MRLALMLIRKRLFKNKIRSLLTILAITIGIATIVSIQISIANAKKEFVRFVNEKVSNADIIVNTPSSLPVEINQNILKKDKNVELVLPRLEVTSFIKSDDEKEKWFVDLVGIDLFSESKAASMKILSGQKPKKGEALLVKNNANQHKAKVGQEIK
jgi:ABC-type lipoprotein release transport system permease subunit